MDRISKAVEKARQERAKNRSSSDGASDKFEDQDAVITKTKKVKLDETALRKNLILLSDVSAEYSHAYKVLRTRVWQLLKENGWNSIAVTSCRADEGKSVAAINLSISLAMVKANHSVLLVDMNLMQPSIHKKLGMEVEYGIGNFLLDGVPLDQILVNPGLSRFIILPGHKALPHSSEVLSSARMERLVREFKTRYPSRIVIYDLPPILSTDDVLVFSQYVDGILLVIEEGKSSYDDIKRAVTMLKGTNILGTILNKSKDSVVLDD